MMTRAASKRANAGFLGENSSSSMLACVTNEKIVVSGETEIARDRLEQF
jgi:hypothetical protein